MGGRISVLQALRRAFNFAVERHVITKNPIKGYKATEGLSSRVTYLTPAQGGIAVECVQPGFCYCTKGLH